MHHNCVCLQDPIYTSVSFADDRLDVERCDAHDENVHSLARSRMLPHWVRRLDARTRPYPPFNYHRDYLTQRRKHSNKGKTVMKSQGRKYTRTVVMVDTMDKKVPRGKRRFSLQEGGFIVSFVEFWTNWTEREVLQAIEAALRGVIDLHVPHPR